MAITRKKSPVVVEKAPVRGELEAQIRRFRDGEVDRSSISAFSDATNRLFDELCSAWSQIYFAEARVHMYDDDDGAGPGDFDRVYLSFHRGNDGWGIFVEREHCTDSEGESIRDVPITAASNYQKEVAVDRFLGELEGKLQEALDRKRVEMVARHDALAELVEKAKAKAKAKAASYGGE